MSITRQPKYYVMADSLLVSWLNLGSSNAEAWQFIFPALMNSSVIEGSVNTYDGLLVSKMFYLWIINNHRDVLGAIVIKANYGI